MPDHAKDRAAAIAWARRMLDQHCVILDSETTGLGDDAEIVQLAVLSYQGVTLFDSLIKPSIAIPAGATAIHGIDDARVADAPTFVDVFAEFWKVIRQRPVVIYNRAYDMGRLKHGCRLANQAMPITTADSHCAMLMYAQYVGDWNDYRESYRWQKLEGGDHSALGDCRATLKVLRDMAAAT